MILKIRGKMRNYILSMLILSLLMTSCQKETQKTGPILKTYYLGIIHNYLDAPELSAEATKALQEDHLSNIERLYEAGLMPLAGLFADKNEFDWAGLFFYDVPTKDSANKLAETDPACKSGHLYVVNYPLECEGEIKFKEPVAMTFYTSVFVYSDESKTIDFTYDEFLGMLLEPVEKDSSSARIALKGDFIEFNKENLTALYILEGISIDEVLAVVDNLPATSRKRWPTKVIQWYGPMGLRLE